jgi:chitinase
VLPVPNRHEIVGYYPGWKSEFEVDARLLTVVNYAFLVIDRDGSLKLDNPAVDVPLMARLVSIKKQNPHLRLMGSVGGWTRSEGFSDMAATPATRAVFVDSVVAFLRKHEFDGIDLDWEYPGAIGVPCAAGRTCDRPEDKRNFVALARELRTALDAAGATDRKRYLSTIAAGADRAFVFDGDSSRWLAELAEALDWINLMTYDYHGTWEKRAGLLAPLHRDPADPDDKNIDATLKMFLDAGVPPRKLTLGLPFYPKGWKGCKGLYQECTEALPDPVELDAALPLHWNAAAQVPYRFDPGSGTFLTYDDERSIRNKVRYARARGLLGAMYWEIEVDRDRSLARAVASELHR